MATSVAHERHAVRELAVRTGDLILYDGTHPLHVMQKAHTGCRWSQVGLVIVEHATHDPWVFESTKLSPCLDVLSGQQLEGVQLSRLHERIATFPGQVALRRLAPPFGGDRIATLEAFARQSHALPFNDSKWTAVRAFHRRNKDSDGRSYFCSELVAAAYQAIGVLLPPPIGRTPSNHIPAEFASSYRGGLALGFPYSFAAEEVICPAA